MDCLNGTGRVVGWGCSQVASGVSAVGGLVSEVVRRILNCMIFLPENPVTKNREIHLIPESFLNAYAATMYTTSVKSDAIDHKYSNLVKEVGTALAAKSDRPDFNYEFIVVKQNDKSGKPVVNAFCLPGGKVAITEGLLEKLESETTDEEELNNLELKDKIAAVLGHEITHACANHGLLRSSVSIVVFIAGKIVNYAVKSHLVKKGEEKEETIGKSAKEIKAKRRETEQNAENMAWLAERIFGFATYFATQHYSQDNEFESDRVGMRYAKEAGYDARASIWLQSLFVKMHKRETVQGSGMLASFVRLITFTSDLLSSHPPSEERVKKCRATWEALQKV